MTARQNLPERMCFDGCGRSLAQYGRRRTYHDECTCPEALRTAKLRSYEADRQKRRKTGEVRKLRRIAGNSEPNRVKQKMCQTCFDYSDRRALVGCPECHEPYLPEKPLDIRDFMTNHFQETR